MEAWILAIRPRTLPAAAAPVVVATGMAAARDVMAPLPALAALVAALMIQIATNLANDYYDFLKGGDSEDRVGPTRVVQAGLLPAQSVIRAALGVLGLTSVIGLYLVWVGGLPILIVGVLSLLCALAYTGGPYPLAYRGLGDLFVFVFFGLVAVGGTYWVQARDFPPDLLLAGSAMGALITGILVVNNLRDRETDERAGKRTLAVRLGETGTRVQYLVLVLAALAIPLIGIWLFGWSPWTLLPIGGARPLLSATATVLTFHDPRELNLALANTARGVTWYAALLAVGFVLGRPDIVVL